MPRTNQLRESPGSGNWLFGGDASGPPLSRLIHTSHSSGFQEACEPSWMLHGFGTLELLFCEETGAWRDSSSISARCAKNARRQQCVVVMTDVTEAALLQAKLAHTEKDGALGHWCAAWLMKSTIRCRRSLASPDLLFGEFRAAGICPGATGLILQRGRAEPG